jgi:hypothetical protein
MVEEGSTAWSGTGTLIPWQKFPFRDRLVPFAVWLSVTVLLKNLCH